MTIVKFGRALLPALLVAAASSAAAQETPTTTAEESAKPSSWTWWLVATEGFRLRTATDEPTGVDPADPTVTTDAGLEPASDLRLHLSAGATDPGDRFTLQTNLSLWWTVSGGPDDAGYGWTTIHSEEDSPVWIDVYELYGAYRGHGLVEEVRLGRQDADHGRPALFDGAYVMLEPAEKVRAFAFGGRGVHFFELGADLLEDYLAAVGAQVLATPSLMIEAEYRYVHEDLLASEVTPGETIETAERVTISDHYYGVEAFYRHDDWLRLRAHARGLDDQPGWFGGAARLVWQPLGLGLDARVDVQAQDLFEINDFDEPFFAVLGQSEAHGKVHVDAWKGFETGAGSYEAHLGYDGRILAGGREEGPFNRDFHRTYVLVSGQDIGVKGPFLHATAELNADDLADLEGEGQLALGGAAGYDHRLVRLEAGSYYHRWKYTYFMVPEETSNVRGYYADVKARPLDWLGVRARYSFEVFDRNLHTFMLSLTQSY